MGQASNFQIWLLIKNPQFFSKNYETWSILYTHELVILIKFHGIWRKIVDFLLVANFQPCPSLDVSLSKNLAPVL